MPTPASLWKQRHGRGEKKLAKALRSHFLDQRARILKALADYDQPTPAIVSQIFRPSDERDLLLEAALPTLAEQVASGAATVWKTRPKETKDFDIAGTLEDFDLPEAIKAAIALAFDDLREQPYWLEIEETTGDAITQTLRDAIDEGLSIPNMRKKLQTTLGTLSKVRATAIARTETTGAFNAGHQSAFAALAEDGTIKGKKWLAILDGDVRPTHSTLDGVTVGPLEDFDVGGSMAPHPGHASLPAEQRVNCRCTVVAVF